MIIGKLLFVGERRSQRSLQLRVTWRSGKLAGKQLFDALSYMDIDPKYCEFKNIFGNSRWIKKNWQNYCVIGMGKIAQGKLDNMGIPYIPIVHPAARGKIRKKEKYIKHVRKQFIKAVNNQQ